MAQLNLYIAKKDPLLGELDAAASELGCSMNELALEIIAAHLSEHVETTRRVRLAREAEMARLAGERKARDQKLVDDHVAYSIYGAAWYLSSAWVATRGLSFDVGALGPAEDYEDEHLAQIVEPLLASTGGHMVSQEQFMSVLMLVGGFTRAQADRLRKDAAKQRRDVVLASEGPFIAGAAKHEIPAEAASAFYHRILFGASNADRFKNDNEVLAARGQEISGGVGEDSKPRHDLILYGLRPSDRSPLLGSPFNEDGTNSVSAIIGQPGSGKSFWLRCHLSRLAALGTRIIAIDPINDYGAWFRRNGGIVVSLCEDSEWHINPLKIDRQCVVNAAGEKSMVTENIDVKINQRLKPLFRLILGAEWDGSADGLIGHGLRAYYDRYGNQEHLMVDLINVMRDQNSLNEASLSDSLIEQRARLIDNLMLKLVAGEFRTFFAYPTNVDLESPVKICFDLSRTRGGLPRTLAAYLAVNATTAIGAASHDRKLILLDEVHRLFAEESGAMVSVVEDLFRIHRHWNSSITLITQFVREEEVNQRQQSILDSANLFILMRSGERSLNAAMDLIGLNDARDRAKILGFLNASADDWTTPGDREPRRAVLVADLSSGQPTLAPFLSVGLDDDGLDWRED